MTKNPDFSVYNSGFYTISNVKLNAINSRQVIEQDDGIDVQALAKILQDESTYEQHLTSIAQVDSILDNCITDVSCTETIINNKNAIVHYDGATLEQLQTKLLIIGKCKPTLRTATLVRLRKDIIKEMRNVASGPLNLLIELALINFTNELKAKQNGSLDVVHASDI